MERTRDHTATLTTLVMTIVICGNICDLMSTMSEGHSTSNKLYSNVRTDN